MGSDFDELYQLFYVAAYGCNRRCEKEIKEVLYAFKKPDVPFLFFEFFLTHPIPSATQIQQFGWKNWEKNLFVLAPFALRMAEHSVIVPQHGKNGASLIFRGQADSQSLRLAFRWDKSETARDYWKHWSKHALHADIGPPRDDGNEPKPWWPEIEASSAGVRRCFALMDHWTFRWQLDEYPKKMGDSTVSKTSAELLARLYMPLFIGQEDTRIPGLFVPIVSSRLYYGGIWIMLPGHNPHGNDESFRKQIGSRLAEVVERTYLPVLTILHEHWLERLHKEYLEEKGKLYSSDHVFDTISVSVADEGANAANSEIAEFRNVFYPLPAPTIDCVSSGGVKARDDLADKFENLLYLLWSRRDSKGPWAQMKKFRDSLIFERYLICSETMADLLGRVIASARTLRKSKETLPACLIVGGAGSGKENLARMLRLFSIGEQNDGCEQPSYFQGEEYVVNLASIRPAPLTAAVIAGVEIKGTVSFDLQGILCQVRDHSKRRPPPTLRLDEFNSMDPDSQGVLLRFLDNSEIVPVGGIKDSADPDETDCFLIGIMNEDPDEISREKAMEFFRKGEYLGKFVGDLLYEHFRRIRRLRPDVMYRMRRNGKFVIPNLNNRRDDIPLLFRVFVAGELAGLLPKRKAHEKTPKLHISLDVLHRLVQDDLSWPGNIRQLQAVAKIVATRLFVEKERGGRHVVTAPILADALKEAEIGPLVPL